MSQYIIVGTNRPQSNSMVVATQLQKIHQVIGQHFEICDLSQIDFSQVNGTQYSRSQPTVISDWVDKISQSRALVMIVPEYNGSMPGILKYFIDHWKFPDSFEYRPVCFVGLGGRFGGLRPVEHLQQVFSYRNAYIFPERVFFLNCFQTIKDNVINDSTALELLHRQAKLFNRFVDALEKAQLDNLSLKNQTEM